MIFPKSNHYNHRFICLDQRLLLFYHLFGQELQNQLYHLIKITLLLKILDSHLMINRRYGRHLNIRWLHTKLHIHYLWHSNKIHFCNLKHIAWLLQYLKNSLHKHLLHINCIPFHMLNKNHKEMMQFYLVLNQTPRKLQNNNLAILASLYLILLVYYFNHYII